MDDRCGIPGCGRVADYGVSELAAVICLEHFELWETVPEGDPAETDVDVLARLG